MISEGPIPDPPPASVTLEFDFPYQESKPGSVATLLIIVALLALLFFIGADAALWLAPFTLLAGWVTLRQLRNPTPRLEIRADGILYGTLLFGDELFAPWSEIQDIEARPLVSRGFLLDVGDRSGLVMDSRIARVLDDLTFRLFSGGKLGLLTPDGITPDKLREIVEGRILEQARKGAGLLGSADRENTI